jgi:hypothetical protein
MLEMANARLYPFWGSLTEALRTGEPQNEAKQGRATCSMSSIPTHSASKDFSRL